MAPKDNSTDVNAEACFISSPKAISLSKDAKAKLHVKIIHFNFIINSNRMRLPRGMYIISIF